MAGNSFGQLFRITTFGESHGEAIGVIIDGCPAQLTVDLDYIQGELDKRKPGQSKITTQRKESDTVKILSGVFEGKTTGTPIAMIIPNEDQRSKDYSHNTHVFRPSHADYTYQSKYGIRDHRGGGDSQDRQRLDEGRLQPLAQQKGRSDKGRRAGQARQNAVGRCRLASHDTGSLTDEVSACSAAGAATGAAAGLAAGPTTLPACAAGAAASATAGAAAGLAAGAAAGLVHVAGRLRWRRQCRALVGPVDDVVQCLLVEPAVVAPAPPVAAVRTPHRRSTSCWARPRVASLSMAPTSAANPAAVSPQPRELRWASAMAW